MVKREPSRINAMNYRYKIDLNPEYPYIQEIENSSSKCINWKLEEIMLGENEIYDLYQNSWNRVRKWLKENHPELLL